MCLNEKFTINTIWDKNKTSKEGVLDSVWP